MREEQGFAQLVGEIYDTALEPGRWTDALARIAAFSGGQAGALHSKDTSNPSIEVHYQYGLDPDYVQIYFQRYAYLDPLASVLPLFDIDKVVSITDLVPYDEYCQGKFFREWVRPQGWVDAASSALRKSTASREVLSIFRNQESGLVDESMRRRVAAIVPHVRRATLISNIIDRKEIETASLADALDGLSAGVIFVDTIGRIVHANISANIILGEDDFLRAAGGRLIAADAKVNSALREIFVAADEGAANVAGISLPLTARGGERYVAHVLPLRSGARRRAGAAATVFVCKATMENLNPDFIANLYKLTPAELRVLRAIVDVGGVPEVAASLGVAVTTIKTHLGRLFEKTGVGRQADLVKLVAGFSTPLVS
jgi:DNA-binding CsgD family transcriptional regulator